MNKHKISFAALGIESTPDYPDAQGTEGPWVFDSRSCVVRSVHPRTGMRPAGDQFPRVCQMGNDHTPQLVDGHLIAAAPELDSAALEVMKSFEAYNLVGEGNKPEDQWDEYDAFMVPAWRALKAAIEKATTPKRNNDD